MHMHRKIISANNGGYTIVYARDEDGQWWQENSSIEPGFGPTPVSDFDSTAWGGETAKRLTLKEGVIINAQEDFEDSLIDYNPTPLADWEIELLGRDEED